MSARHLLRTFSFVNPLNHGRTFPGRVCYSNFSTIASNPFQSNVIAETGENPKKKKTAIIPKITLINGNDLTITTLEEAQKLSKRRDLKLVKIVDLDSKTQRPVYKLMTGTEYHSEDLKQRALKKENKQNSIKGEKVLIINHKIYEHDLQTHTKKIKKWIDKMYEVRIVINGDSNNMEKAESVYKLLESSMDKEMKIVQKRQKGSDIKFQILPPIKSKKGEDNL